jgi:hypothetical protein
MRRLLTLLLASGLVAVPAAQVAPRRQMQATIEPGPPPGRARVLASVDALPVHIATAFAEPAAFVQSASGQYLVFDRRGQSVYAIDAARTTATKIVQVGEERGRIIRPTAFAPGTDGSFVVADQPGAGVTRIQRFADRGYLLNGFTLPAHPGPPLVVGGIVGGGVHSLQYAGDSIFLSQPNSGSLITEYSWDGRIRRAFAGLRTTGQESDGAVHLALNSGLPLVDPDGGFYFVFQAGIPVFRKYDAAGEMVFERHIEGRELDQTLRTQPSAWPRRRAPDGTEWPAVPVLVRTAAVDPRGTLWVALEDGTIFRYSPNGEKVGTLQLRGAGPLAATSLFFSGASRLLVTPGCYIFNTASADSRR